MEKIDVIGENIRSDKDQQYAKLVKNYQKQSSQTHQLQDLLVYDIKLVIITKFWSRISLLSKNREHLLILIRSVGSS